MEHVMRVGVLVSLLGCGGTTSHIDASIVPDAARVIALDPDSMTADGGVVTAWPDLVVGNGSATPTGSPPRQLIDGVAFAVLDGTDDRLDGVWALPQDDELTIWTLTAQLTDPGGRLQIFDASDNGQPNRGPQIQQAFTNRSALIDSDVGAAGYVLGTTEVRLHRHVFRDGWRATYEDGVWKAGSAIPATAVRAATVYRIGAQLGAGAQFAPVAIGLLYAYAGTPSLRSEESIDAGFRERFGRPEPYQRPTTASSDCSSDPRLIMPEVYYAIVGEPLTIFRDRVHLRDGLCPQTWGGTAPRDLSYDDRVVITPTAAGDTALTLTEGAYSDSAIVRAVELPTTGTKYVATFGDSNTNRLASGGFQWIKTHLGALIEFVGTYGPNAPYSIKHNGHDSWKATYLATAAGDGVDPSPLFNGGVLDMANFEANLALPLGASLDAAIINFGTNDWGNNTDETNLEAHITDSHAATDFVIAALRAQWPAIKIGIGLVTPPGAVIPIHWSGSQASYYAFLSRMHRGVERTIEHFSGREAENVSIMPAYDGVDTVRDMVDALHVNSAPGGIFYAKRILGWMCATLWGST